MIDWLAANWVNILVIALVAVMVFFAARSLIKDKKAGKSSVPGTVGIYNFA